jgi:RNA polymerase sigma-70 factor (ECF subfamily)
LRAEIPLNKGVAAHAHWRHDEAGLIRLAQKGDEAACAALYDRHYDAVYRYCFYRVADAEVAQDLTAEVFVRMVEKLETFQVRGRPLLAWLYTIARNLIYDLHRENGKRQQVPLDEEAQRLPDADIDLARHVDGRIAAERLAAAMEHLTEEQRQVIMLKFMEDLDNARVARLLGKTEGAVKSLQHRALGALRRVLQRENSHEA